MQYACYDTARDLQSEVENTHEKGKEKQTIIKKRREGVRSSDVVHFSHCEREKVEEHK
jgi:hypothetical protein